MAVKVTHILSDGTVVDSMKGHIVPMNEDTMPFYMSIATYARNKKKNTKPKETA